MFETRPFILASVQQELPIFFQEGRIAPLRRVPAGTISGEVQCVRIG